MRLGVLTAPIVFFLASFIVVSSASANETEVENANPGTTAWQLTHPPTSPAVFRQIEGYASLTSVNVGGSISFFVSTSDSSYTMDFYRIGWYGGAGGREVLGAISRPGGLQPTPSPDAYGTFECNWTNPYVLTVPTSWVSGVYLVKLTSASGWQIYIQFVVREDSRNSVYLFQRSITTDQAYNNWPGVAYGGKSLYGFNSANNSPAVKVSFNRPYGIEESYTPTHYGAGFFPEWELNMVRWLESNGYDVTYATNIDVHENPNLLKSHKAFLSVGHDEYWSWEMRANVEAARDAGVGLGFFAGNESYWQMRLEPSSITSTADRTMVAYKSLSDPTTNACLVTILWRQNTCKSSEQAFIGIESSAYNVGDNMVIADASNWALAGTELVNGSTIPGVLGPEVDGLVQADSPAGTALIAHSPLSSSSISDTGPYPAYPYADMVTYTAAASGATVFSVGTMSWSWTLDDYGSSIRGSRLNTAAQQITQNVLARFAGGKAMPPAAPNNLVATAGNAQIGLSWNASAGASSYNVKRSTTNGGPYTTVASPTATSYTDTGLNHGTTYYYVATALNSVGESGNSNQASATPAAIPAAPTNLAATPGNAQVALTWNASAGATSYNVKRSTTTGGPYTTVASPTTTGYTDTGLTNGTTYYYVVTAVNSAGESGNSNQASATPAAVPAAPTNLAATPGNAQVVLSWNASAGATSYNVKRSTTTGGPYTTVASPTTTGYTDTGLTNGTTYYYVVTAVNSAGESGNSNQASAMPASVPAAPTNLAATPGNAQVVLSWNASAGATSYNVKRSTTTGGPYTTVASPTTTGYTDTGLTNGTTYFYVVTAVNSAGESGNSNQASATPAAVPAAPTSLVATPGNAQVVLSWNASAGAASYNVKRSTTTGGPYTTVSSPTTTGYTDTGLTNGTTYFYVVTAVNSVGESGNSNQASVMPASVPAAPTNLVAMAGNAQVVLSWSASAGATSYNVKRSTTTGGPYTTVASPATTGYTDTGLTNGTTYFYVVTAVNSVGESGNSNQASATPAAVPAAPTNLVATAGNAQAALSWNASAGAASCNVKRSTTSGGPYSTAASPTTTSYTDTGLTNGTTYYYVVTAVNSVGESGNSNQASSTPVSAQDFSLSLSSQTTAAVTRGQTAVFSLSVSPINGFNRTVSFACSGAASQSTITCSIVPNPVALSGATAATVGVNITTMSSSLLFPEMPGTLTFVLFAALIAMFYMVVRDCKGHPRLVYGSFLLLVLLASVTFYGCSGGGAGSTAGNNSGTAGTPQGTYSFTVSGTSDSGSTPTHTVEMNVIVQ